MVFQTRQGEGVTDQGKTTVEPIIINSDRYRAWAVVMGFLAKGNKITGKFTVITMKFTFVIYNSIFFIKIESKPACFSLSAGAHQAPAVYKEYKSSDLVCRLSQRGYILT